jgi:pantetheine-phosphate adenylyltransferase
VASSSSKPNRSGVPPNQTAVFTGTFDPITLGHLDVIRRASGIYRRVIVGVGSNPDKSSLFPLDERVRLVRACVADSPGVQVDSFDGLAVRFVRSCGAGVIVRGVRSVADMDYELTMARSNRSLEPAIETFFLPANESYSHISSTLIRQIAREAGRKELAKFVPTPVVEALLAKFRKA